MAPEAYAEPSLDAPINHDIQPEPKHPRLRRVMAQRAAPCRIRRTHRLRGDRPSADQLRPARLDNHNRRHQSGSPLNRTKLAALLTAIPLTLTACSGGAMNDTSEPTPVEQAGCVGPTLRSTEEMYVVTVYECTAGPARVLTFNTNEARDSFVQIAQEFGGTYTTGDKWAAESR